MENNVEVALELGYLSAPPGVLHSLQEVNRIPLDQAVILTTGSQGEPLAALTRMSIDSHRRVSIVRGDLVIMAATPVPGNEKLVFRTINNLHRLGARVVHGAESGVHVSGHAAREDLKLMLNLVRPEYFIPIHGEYRHLVEHAKLAVQMGVEEEKAFVGENGSVFEFSRDVGRVRGTVEAGQVLVDGLGVGDVGNLVLRDRQRLSENGIVVVVVTIDADTGEILSGPELLTRGFVYVRESEDLLDEARTRCEESLEACEERGETDWSTLKSTLRDAIRDFLYSETQRRPMILPIILELDPEDYKN
jgi:ribonuclease J